MANKNRRAQFEEQLKALQDDISTLSKRLSIPSNLSPGTGTTFSKNNSSNNISRDLNYYGTILREQEPPPEPQSYDNQSRIDSSTIVSQTRGQLARLQRELHTISRERDDALYKLRQMERDIENLNATVTEMNKYKIQYDRVQQDNEALKISLDSSERIRKQQKELISLLQRSNATVEGSMLSFNNSVSTIHPHILDKDLRSSGDFSASHSLDAENRSWLNGLATFPHHPHPLSSRQHKVDEHVTFRDDVSQQVKTSNKQLPSRQQMTRVKQKTPNGYSELTGRKKPETAETNGFKRRSTAPISAVPTNASRPRPVTYAARSMTAPPRITVTSSHQQQQQPPPLPQQQISQQYPQQQSQSIKLSSTKGPISSLSNGRPPKHPHLTRPSTAPSAIPPNRSKFMK